MPDQPIPPANGPSPAATSVPSVDTIVQTWREDAGSDRAALRRAGKDNQKMRRRHAALQQELEGYKTRNPQGSIVLVGEDVTAWNELKPVLVDVKTKGIKIPDLPKVIKERDDLLGEKVKADTKSAARKAGEALGFKGDGLDLFEEIAGDKGIVFEEKDVTVMKGKKPVKEKQWHAKKASDDKATPVPVAELKEFKPWLKALRAASTEEGDNGDDSEELAEEDEESTDEEVRTAIPEQRTSGKSRGKVKDIAGGYMEKHYPLPSEVAKAQKDKE